MKTNLKNMKTQNVSMEEEKEVSINQKPWYKILQSQTQINKFVHNNLNLLT